LRRTPQTSPRPASARPPGAASSRVAAVWAALLLLATGGCAPQRIEPLRVGISATPSDEFAYLAQVRHFFEQEHVPVRLIEFGSLADAREAYERGNLDGFFGTVFEVLQAHVDCGRTPRIVRVVDAATGFDVLVARPALGHVAMLRGHAVAVRPGTRDLYVLARALGRAGLELLDVNAIEVASDSVQIAFDRGRVDAAVCGPPASIAIARSGVARALFSSSEIAGEVVDVVAFDDATLALRPRDVAGFLRAYDRATAWSIANSDEADQIMAAREQVPPQAFRNALEHDLCLVGTRDQDRYFGPDRLLAQVVDATSRVLVQTGKINRPVRAADVVAPAPVD
jgi:NitT/TauT family transport system substrate-binding protein